jgi:endoglucanase
MLALTVILLLATLSLANVGWAARSAKTVAVSTGTRSAATAHSPNRYAIVGNRIETSAGKQVILHGVNRPSLEWSCTGETVTGSAAGIPASDFTTMVNRWNANSVRIDLDQDMLLKGSSQYCRDYEATVERAVSDAQAAGMIVILDVHNSDAGHLRLPRYSFSGQCMPDRNTMTFWREMAAVYKKDPGVWFELYNEPVPPDRSGALGGASAAQWRVWRDGGTVTCPRDDGTEKGTFTFHAVGMQSLYDIIRAAGAANIVVVDGLDVAGTFSGVPLLAGTNIAYGIHPYVNTVSPDDVSLGVWGREFGRLSATHAVLATEFGDYQCGNEEYDNAILHYMNTHGVGYDAWAWWVGGCGFPSLITDPAGDCVETMGCVIQQNMLSFGPPGQARASHGPETRVTG